MQSQLTAQKKEIATLQSDRQKTANEIGALQTKLKLLDSDSVLDGWA